MHDGPDRDGGFENPPAPPTPDNDDGCMDGPPPQGPGQAKTKATAAVKVNAAAPDPAGVTRDCAVRTRMVHT